MIKSKTQYLLVVFTAISTFTFGQVSVEIQNMGYQSGGSISNCGVIDFEDNSTITVQFGVNLEKPTSMVVGDGYLRIYTRKSSSANEIQRDWEIVQSILWGGDDTTESYFTSFSVPLDASDFNTSGGKFFARYISSSDVHYNSCEYSIEKDELPSFTLSPQNVNIPCSNTDSRTFTVTPANIPNGANVTYQWNYSGWTPVSSSGTSITLQPSSGVNLPSDVSVTPSINGVAQTTLTSDVERGGFNPINYDIIGDSYVCDTGIYTIDDLPNDILITSVESSDDGIATVSFVNDQITVAKVSDGLVSITATLVNACGQPVTRTKSNIQVGIPNNIINNAVVTGDSAVCGTQYYTYTLSGASHPCINDVDWEVSPNLEIISENSSSVTVKKSLFASLNAGLITASISGSDIEIKKGVWVG